MSDAAVAAETFGVPQLDKLLGDVPHGARFLLANDPGVEATPFLRQVVQAHLSAGDPVIVVTTTRPPERVAPTLGLAGSPEDFPGLHIVDAYSPLMGMASTSRYLVPNADDLLSVAGTIARAGQENPGAILILDDVSSWLNRYQPAELHAHLPSLEGSFAYFANTFAPLTLWGYDGEEGQLMERFDAIVRLQAVEDRVVFSHYFSVDRARWQADLDRRPRLYKVSDAGGVLVYIPKVVVTGPHNAGKSSFIRAASDEAKSADRLGTTVALDHGHLEVDGLSVDLFGTPGQERFDPIIRTVANQALGVILVVDSTRPETFPRAQAMLRLTWQMGLPAIVAANKQDVPGAMSPHDVASQLGLPSSIPVIGCIAADTEQARSVLQNLLERIMQAAPRGDGQATAGQATVGGPGGADP